MARACGRAWNKDDNDSEDSGSNEHESAMGHWSIRQENIGLVWVVAHAHLRFTQSGQGVDG